VGAWKFPRTHIGGLRRTGKTAFSLRQLVLSTLLRPPRNRTPCCGKVFRFMGLNFEDGGKPLSQSIIAASKSSAGGMASQPLQQPPTEAARKSQTSGTA